MEEPVCPRLGARVIVGVLVRTLGECALILLGGFTIAYSFGGDRGGWTFVVIATFAVIIGLPAVAVGFLGQLIIWRWRPIVAPRPARIAMWVVRGLCFVGGVMAGVVMPTPS